MLMYFSEWFRRALGVLMITAAALAHADSRKIDTAFGEVTVPGTPQRIVTLYEGALDTALAVGVHPVGAIVTRGGSHVADYIRPRAGNIAIVGTAGETNLEAVIAQAPDLILASPYTSEAQYRLLSQIAPTIVPEVPAFDPDNWKRETRLFARALGRDAEAEAVLARVAEKIQEVSAQVNQALPAEEQRHTALVRWMPQGPLVMNTGLFSAGLLKAVGFEVDDAGIVAEGRPHSHPLSLENLGQVDFHSLFLATLNADGEQALAAARQSPAFQRLSVARANRIVTVSGQLWTSASGPLAALEILDDIAGAVTEGALAPPAD